MKLTLARTTGIILRQATGPGFFGALLVAMVALVQAARAEGPVTARDGIYSSDQAERGKRAFATACATCHGYTLKGGLFGPAISGSRFADHWHDATVGGLLDFARTQMPPGKAGTLSPATYRDVVAFILSGNGYPAGANELPSDQAVLDEILIPAD